MSSSPSTISLNENQIISDTYAKIGEPLSPQKLDKNEKKKSRLQESLEKLANLISNITESYTTAIFVADQQNKILHSLAHHSLSREYINEVTIPFGRGLVGWTAENKVRITVCPFEHDSSTLLYYPVDQALKSFIAVPILDKNENLLGVIACDSKKNYAFAKITEKILVECATQAQILIELHLDNQKLSDKAPNPNLKSNLDKIFDKLRAARTEEQLFEDLCKIPQDLIAREAFIALLTSHEGFGEATFYTSANESRIEHHLVDLVCKHKKILSTERSVHVLPHDDIRARSFLSVPINVFNKEAGALNVLSGAFKAFSPSDIQALEKLAKFVGLELERLRSKTIATARQVGPSLLPWNHFLSQGNAILEKKTSQLSMLRIQFNNLFNLEQSLGVKNISEIHEQTIRFVQQLAPQPMLASAPYGTSIYLLGETSQIESVSKRLVNIISRIPQMDSMDFYEKLPDNASDILLHNLDIIKIEIKNSHSTIEESISNFKSAPKNITKIEPSEQINKPLEKKRLEIKSEQTLKNGFDKRLSQALKSQEDKQSTTSQKRNTDSDDFILGETNETKEVANARFW